MLRIIEVGKTRMAKDGREFFTVTFRPGFGQRQISRNFWQQFKRDKDGNNTTEKYWERLSPEEAVEALKSKQVIEGKKVTHTVEGYEVNGNTVNTYSAIVFPDETAITVFKANRKVIIDEETGEALYELPERNPSIAISEEEVENARIETKETFGEASKSQELAAS